VAAQTLPETLDEVGRLGLGGMSRTVALQGRYAYVGQGARLEVLDVSDLAQPRLLGRLVTPSEVAAVAVDGDTGYLAEGTGRFTVLDLSVPSEPRPVGTVDGVGWTQQLVVAGTYVFAAAAESGLAIIDVSVPAKPELVTFVDTDDRAAGVAVANGFAYIADTEGGLRVVDVGDPRSPTDIGAASGVEGRAVAVAHSGGFVYVATVEHVPWPSRRLGARRHDDDRPMPPILTDCRLLALDVSDPASPELVGSAEVGSNVTEWLTALAVTDTHAFVSGNDYFHGGTNGRLEIFDITAPSQPVRRGSTWHRSVAADLAVEGGKVLAATGYGGLETIDASDVSAPSQVGRYGSPTAPRSVASVGGLAYVADHGFGGAWGDGRLFVLDPRDPAMIRTVGQAAGGSHYDGLCEEACQVVAVGDRAYIADAIRGLYVFDIADPRQPSLAGRMGVDDVRAGPRRIAVDGTYAYAAAVRAGTRVGGFYVIDVSDPASPSVVGAMEGLEADDVAVADGTAYVVTGGDLQLVDVSDPLQPRQTGRAKRAFLASRVAAASTDAYVASSAGNLHLIDASDSDDPHHITYLRLGISGSQVTDLLLAGDTVYAVHARGVVGVDVANPTQPEVVARWSAPEGDVLSGALGDRDLYLVHSSAGQIVLRPSAGTEPTATPTSDPSATPTAASTATLTPSHAFAVFLPWASNG
jgi:hypothetical protein